MESKKIYGKIILVIFIAICLLATRVQAHTHSTADIQEKIKGTQIMYGSAIRIRAVPFAYYLHSHRVNYPEGSGYQSVTGFQMDNDYNSLWAIKEPHQEHIKTYKDQVKCGESIRLEHALTKKNLHSEQIFQSMVTKGQEVSCFGNGGHGNQNDNWIISCINKKEGEKLMGGDQFELIHEKTEKKVKMSKYYEYSYVNWQNCPFQGQLQVSASDKSTKQTQFKIVGGVFFKENVKEEKEDKVQENEQL